MMDKTNKIYFTILVAVTFVIPLFSFAQLGDQLLPPSGPEITTARIELLLRKMGTWLITVGIVVAVIVMVWGGITYMLAGDSQDKTSKAVKKIKNGIIGAAIILAVGLILRTLSSVIIQSFFGV